MKPILTFSFDIESFWGLIESNPLYFRRIYSNFYKIKKTTEKLIRLFDYYQIPATWAFVGQLLINYYEDIYYLKTNSNYKYIIKKKSNKNLIEELNLLLESNILHDIGYHSFSHINFTKISYKVADIEISRKKNIEENYDIKFNTFIYPNDDINYINILSKHGIRVYRNKLKSLENDINKYKKTFLKIFPCSVYPLYEKNIWSLPSSMIFYDPKFHNVIKYKAFNGIFLSYYTNSIFHIFSHPWNYFIIPNLFNDLKIFLKYIYKLNKKKYIRIMTINDVVDYYEHKN